MSASKHRLRWWHQWAPIVALAVLASMPAPVLAAGQVTGEVAAMRRHSRTVPAAPVESHRALAAPAETLVAEPVRAPAGGVKLNLRGRYHSAVRRTADGVGGAHHVCDGPTGAVGAVDE